MTGGRPQPVSPAEIADLLAWARSVTETGPAADPTQRVAYLRAKAELLARITAQATAPLPDPSKDTT